MKALPALDTALSVLVAAVALGAWLAGLAQLVLPWLG